MRARKRNRSAVTSALMALNLRNMRKALKAQSLTKSLSRHIPVPTRRWNWRRTKISQ